MNTTNCLSLLLALLLIPGMTLTVQDSTLPAFMTQQPQPQEQFQPLPDEEEDYDLINLAKAGFQKISTYIKGNKKKSALMGLAVIAGWFLRSHEKKKIANEHNSFDRTRIGNAEIQQLIVRSQRGMTCAQHALKNAIAIKKSIIDPEHREEHLQNLQNDAIVNEWVEQAAAEIRVAQREFVNEEAVRISAQGMFYNHCLELGLIEHRLSHYTDNNLPIPTAFTREQLQQINNHANALERPYVNYYCNHLLTNGTYQMPQALIERAYRTREDHLPRNPGELLDFEGVRMLINQCQHRPAGDPFALPADEQIIIFERIVQNPEQIQHPLVRQNWLDKVNQLRQPGTHIVMLCSNPEVVAKDRDATGHWISVVINRPQDPNARVQYLVTNSFLNGGHVYQADVQMLINQVERNQDGTPNQTAQEYNQRLQRQPGFFTWLKRKLLLIF